MISKMQRRKFVLFDFDGVIADSYSVGFETAKKLCPYFTEKDFHSVFEGNAWERHKALMSRVHGPECRHDLDWFEIFTPAFEEHAKLFPGIREVVEKLSHEYILVIISSTLTSPIQGFLEKHHIGRYFSEVMGADVHISKREKISMLFEKYQTSASECVFVTDTLGDMDEARAAGVDAIGVSWGFHPCETLAKGEPFRIVDNPTGVVSAVSDYFVASV